MPAGRPGEASTDGYTQRDIWRKSAGRGLAADAAPGSDRVSRWRHGLCAWAAVTPGPPARYMRGPSQAHARSITLRIREPGRQTPRGSADHSQVRQAARPVSAGEHRPRLGSGAMSSGERRDRASAAVMLVLGADGRARGAWVSPGSQVVALGWCLKG